MTKYSTNKIRNTLSTLVSFHRIITPIRAIHLCNRLESRLVFLPSFLSPKFREIRKGSERNGGSNLHSRRIAKSFHPKHRLVFPRHSICSTCLSIFPEGKGGLVAGTGRWTCPPLLRLLARFEGGPITTHPEPESSSIVSRWLLGA